MILSERTNKQEPVVVASQNAPQERMRVLVLLGSVPLMGHALANIEVIEALREKGIEALFVTHEQWGHLAIQPELERRGLRWTTATYFYRFTKGMPLRLWLRNFLDIARGSAQLL